MSAVRPTASPPTDTARRSPNLIGVARHFALAEAAHRACPDLAVVGTGYSYLRHYALEAGEANLRDDRVTLVGLGRGAIAYPDFALDATMEKKKACYHRQLLHDADAGEGQRARAVRRRVRSARSDLRQAPPGNPEKRQSYAPAEAANEASRRHFANQAPNVVA